MAKRRSQYLSAVKITIGLMQLFSLATCFRVAVYEHLDPSREADKPLDRRMLDSAAIYEEQARQASLQEIHLLVFPEYGMTGLRLPWDRAAMKPYLQVIPQLTVGPSKKWIPCLEMDTGFNVTMIRRMSCAARESGVVLVVNMATILVCLQHELAETKCPMDGAYIFNTDVVFDSDGTVLALYHKINTYLEPLFDKPPYYSTDIGITFTTSKATFGLVTCFDIVWRHPLVTLVRERGVRHIILSSAWLDGLPYLTSIQSHLALAIGLNITIIAANLHQFPDDRGGSGIYSGMDGIMNYTYGPLSEGLLVVTDLELQRRPVAPKRLIQNNDTINYEGIIYNDLSEYSLRELNPLSESANATNGNVTCNVSYKFEAEEKTQDSERGCYYLAAYQGILNLGNGAYHMAIETCTVFWCANGNRPVSTCSHPPVSHSQARLVQLTLDGNFSTSFLYPLATDYNLQLINTSNWYFTKKKLTDGKETAGQIATVESFLYRPLVISIFGRNYEQD